MKNQLQLALDWLNAPDPKPLLLCRLKGHREKWSIVKVPVWNFADWEYQLAPKEFWIVEFQRKGVMTYECFTSSSDTMNFIEQLPEGCEHTLIRAKELTNGD